MMKLQVTFDRKDIHVFEIKLIVISVSLHNMYVILSFHFFVNGFPLFKNLKLKLFKDSFFSFKNLKKPI